MRLRWFVALTSLLLIVVGTTVVIYDALDGFTGADDQVISAPGLAGGGGGADGADGAEVDDPALDGTWFEVGGRVEEVHLERATPDPGRLTTPLTIDSERGFGNGGAVTGVTVGSTGSTIEWDGGRPFVLASGPGIVLNPLTVDLADGDLVCSLGRSGHALLRGDYQLDTPVAVGREGIATPHDRVTFTAGPDAGFTAHGDATIRLAGDQEHSFTGPGLAYLVGDLEIVTQQGGQRAGSLELANGAFDLTFSPTEGGGWTVSGRVQSRVVGDLVLGDV